MDSSKSGQWWNGGWQRWGKSTWTGEQISYIRDDGWGTVTLNEPAKGQWVEDENQCKVSDNPLANGVFIWTEIKGTGHAFVSVHEDNSPFVFTYGRFGRRGNPAGMVGDGILNSLKFEEARAYYKTELYQMGAKVFLITDADPQIAKLYFEKLWNAGSPVKQTEYMGDSTKKNGKTIDQYDVTGVNCTTHAVKGVKVAGSKVFEGGYTTNSQMRIDYEDDFAIPVSLQRHLESEASMLVVDVTSEFRKQYPNDGGITPMDETTTDMRVYRTMAETASAVGKVSPYSGGTIEGVLNGVYDVSK